MSVLAIDPGPTHSAFVVYDGDSMLPVDFGKLPNAELRSYVGRGGYDVCAIEMIASYGMPVGAEVFQTCVEIGRFVEIVESSGLPHVLVYRKDVKLALCNSPRANDASIRQALIDRYGGKDKAIGRKANQGPLYGVTADVWSALAIAVTVTEQTKEAA